MLVPLNDHAELDSLAEDEESLADEEDEEESLADEEDVCPGCPIVYSPSAGSTGASLDSPPAAEVVLDAELLLAESVTCDTGQPVSRR